MLKAAEMASRAHANLVNGLLDFFIFNCIYCAYLSPEVRTIRTGV
jgi:hypothetical protein